MFTTPTLSDATRATNRNRKTTTKPSGFKPARFERSKANVLSKWAQVHAQIFAVPVGAFGTVKP